MEQLRTSHDAIQEQLAGLDQQILRGQDSAFNEEASRARVQYVPPLWLIQSRDYMSRIGRVFFQIPNFAPDMPLCFFRFCGSTPCSNYSSSGWHSSTLRVSSYINMYNSAVFLCTCVACVHRREKVLLYSYQPSTQLKVYFLEELRRIEDRLRDELRTSTAATTIGTGRLVDGNSPSTFSVPEHEIRKHFEKHKDSMRLEAMAAVQRHRDHLTAMRKGSMNA